MTCWSEACTAQAVDIPADGIEGEEPVILPTEAHAPQPPDANTLPTLEDSFHRPQVSFSGKSC